MSHINDGRDSSSLSPQLEGGMFTCHTEIRCSESLVLSNLSRAWDYSRRSSDAPDVSERIPELAFSIHRESHSWLSWQENLWFLLFPFRLLSSALLLCLTKAAHLVPQKVIPQPASVKSEIHNMRDPLGCMRTKTMSTSWSSYRNARTVGPGQAPCCLPTRNSDPATLHSFNPASNSSALTAPGDGNREVIPKAMPKQKVKRNEEIIWNEMRVFHGLDHPNVGSIKCFGASIVPHPVIATRDRRGTFVPSV